MLEEILSQQLVDLEGMLILNYKKLSLNETQTMLLLVILRLEKTQCSYITPKMIAPYMSLSEREIDQAIMTLINQSLLAFENNSLSTKPLIEAFKKIFTKTNTEEKPKQVNLVQAFENEFGRSLTPIEIEILKEWKQCQYSDEFIIQALKEATLSNVHNMRYIEKILVDWAKHGMKTTGREKVQINQKPIELVEYEWWNEND